MGLKNPMHPGNTYFLTLTVTDWVDIFSRPVYRHILIDTFNYCIQHKNLELFCWVIMSNHLHFIARNADENISLSPVIRDFKSYAAKSILAEVEKHPKESRRKWMLERFRKAGKKHPKSTKYKFWREGNEPKLLDYPSIFDQKMNYIHQNPVKAEIVQNAEDYLYSSAIDYAGGKGLLPVTLV